MEEVAESTEEEALPDAEEEAEEIVVSEEESVPEPAEVSETEEEFPENLETEEGDPNEPASVDETFKICIKEDRRYIYLDETGVEFSLDEDSIGQINACEGCKIEWFVTVDGEEEPIHDLLKEGRAAVSEGQRGVVINGTKLLEGDNPLEEGQDIHIWAQVIVNGQVVGETAEGGIWLQVRQSWENYDIPSDIFLLPEWDRWMDTVWYESNNSQYPDGMGEDVPIKNLTVKNPNVDDASGEPVINVEPGDGGWNIKALRFGQAIITVEYQLFGQEETASRDINVWVGPDVWDLYVETNTATFDLLPEASVELTAVMDRYCYNEEKDHFPGDVSEVDYQWEVEYGGDRIKLSGTEGKTISVTAGLECGEAGIRVRAYLDGEEVQSQFFNLYINESYYVVEPIGTNKEDGTALEPGETLPVNPVLKFFSLDQRYGVDVNLAAEKIRYRLEWDSNCLDIKEGDREVSTENPYVSGSFSVIRKNTCETELRVIAEKEFEDGRMEEIARRDVWFNNREYKISPKEDVPNVVFKGETPQVDIKMDLSPIPKGITDKKIVWHTEFRNWDWGKEEPEYAWSSDSEKAAWDGVSVSEDEATLSLDLDTLKKDTLEQDGRLEIWIGVFEGEREVASWGQGMDVRTAVYDYYLDGDVTRLPTEDWFIGKNLGYYVVNTENPDGADKMTTVTAVSSSVTDVVSVAEVKNETDEDAEGWNLHMEKAGESQITVTYRNDAGEEQEHTFKIFVEEKQRYEPQFGWWNPSLKFLPGDEIHLLLNIEILTYNPETGEITSEWADPDAYQYVWTTDGDGKVTKLDEQGYEVTYQAESLDKEPYGGVGIIAEVYAKDDTDRENCLMRNEEWINIRSDYTYLPYSWIYREAGSKVSLSDLDLKVYRRYVDEQGEHHEKEVFDYTFRTDWNDNQQRGVDEELIAEIINDQEIKLANLTKKDQSGIIYLRKIFAEKDGEETVEGVSAIIVCPGHKWKTVNKKATCIEEGESGRRCEICGCEEIKVLPKTAHKIVTVIDKAATCVAAGKRHQECAVCHGQRKNLPDIPATGKHRFGKYVTTKAATALAAGLEVRTCSVCKKKESRAIKKLTPVLQMNVNVKSTLPMKTGQSYSGLKVTKMAKGDYVASWKSSNTKVLKVSGKKNGTCTLKAQKKAGTVKLTITLKSGKKVTLKVKVAKTAVKTTKVTVPKTKITMKRKAKYTLKPVLTPITSTEKITYASSNKNVVAVSSKGVLTAKKKGTATITVRSGKKSVKVKVTVK